MSTATIVTGSRNIYMAHLLALKYALKLECLGMSRHGRSAYAIVKAEFGFRGDKKSVLVQLEAHINKLVNERVQQMTNASQNN